MSKVQCYLAGSAFSGVSICCLTNTLWLNDFSRVLLLLLSIASGLLWGALLADLDD